MRKISVVTVGRSDFGIYLPLLRAARADPDFELRVIASGSHLSPACGSTVNEILTSGIEVAERVDMLLSADTPQAVAKSTGLAVLGFADVFARSPPDILVVLGDRFEMHAAALAAVPFRIPIAHIHGGEVTIGAMDEALRHAITKYAHLHFAATQEHADRIVQLGEEAWRVTVSGAPSLDNLKQGELMSDSELSQLIQLPLEPAPLLVTFHAETLRYDQVDGQINSLVEALDQFDLPILFTRPNADMGHRAISHRIDGFALRNRRVRVVDSLGVRGYFSLMRRARAMIGNSSSGIIEAASFELPVVNIGIRQLGRPRSQNVIDVDHGAESISDGIRRALDPEFRRRLVGMKNVYGAGDAARRILDGLRRTPLDERLILKRFHDLPMRWNPDAQVPAALPLPVPVPQSVSHHGATTRFMNASSPAIPRRKAMPGSGAAGIPDELTDEPRCVLLGGGGHARVVIEALLAAGTVPYGVLDSNESHWNELLFGVRVLGGDELLPELFARGVRHFAVGVGSTNSTQLRRALFESGKRFGLIPWTVQHPRAICSTSCRIGAGAQLLAGSIVGTAASIGENCIVNSGAIVEHDCLLESHVHISPGVRLAGNVRVGECAHVGIGATVKQGVTIGARSVIGAGAVIIDDVPPDVLVVGVPGRVHKRLAA